MGFKPSNQKKVLLYFIIKIRQRKRKVLQNNEQQIYLKRNSIL